MASASSMLCFSVFAVLCLSRVLCAENDIITDTPEYIIPCSRSDPQLDVCIQSSFQHLRPYLVAGIPELGLPSVEPMFIDRLVMENGNGPVRVKAVFTNVTVKGASNFNVTKIRSDLRRLRIDLGLSVPKVEITGKYEVTGNVLLFPVRSQGDFWATFMDIAGIGKIYGKEVVRNDIKFMNAERLLIDFRLQKSRFKIRDTVNDGSIIGEAMNQFLNNNAAEIIDEMRPAASASVARHFQGFLNGAISKIPIDLWLKP